MAKSKYSKLPLPGNSSGLTNFSEEQKWVQPDDSNNGNLGQEGLAPPRPLTGPVPFGPLKGGL